MAEQRRPAQPRCLRLRGLQAECTRRGTGLGAPVGDVPDRPRQVCPVRGRRCAHCAIVYLTPFFPAGSNHRYDAATFEGVDPLLGGDAALIDLVAAAHARGMKVGGDLTANHSVSSHEWFQRALTDPAAPEAGYYHFSPDYSSYESWRGVPSLPKFNWASAGLCEAYTTGEDSVVAHWLKPPFNLDGWRLDVGNMAGRLGAQDVNHEVATLIRDRVVAVNPDALLLGEPTSDAGPDADGSG
ncbi:alpha-amylase family glycosyl hydrolase [Pseudarthrobacter sp. P1]|uniref:alpha-amylase family glycosyl hydrolase n=1 Tax=Pseudarthrobacter sp. P1 TaxID=3418418 RepID=UPI003CF17F11